MSSLAESESPAKSLHERKAVLRAVVLAERDLYPPAERKERSRLIVESIAALPGFRSASRVLLTSSFGSEVDTRPLVDHTLATGKILLLPLVNKTARMLELYEVVDPQSQLARGTYGIAEPRPERCRRATYDEVEWVLVPGVVYADDGFRIGYGGGYYYRLLPLLKAGTPRVSAAFQFQRRPQVPHGVHDQKIDLIVTDAGPYAVR
ncbi:MAG: 5-formyltetrahydrofolate cyclo-ligase [Betaproteobacteria bacterium]